MDAKVMNRHREESTFNMCTKIKGILEKALKTELDFETKKPCS
jgi:hypothetical protein